MSLLLTDEPLENWVPVQCLPTRHKSSRKCACGVSMRQQIGESMVAYQARESCVRCRDAKLVREALEAAAPTKHPDILTDEP